MTDDFERTLRMDPLLEAEKLTNKSYKDDPLTQALGYKFLQAKAQYLKDELSIRNDTYRGCDFEYAVRIMDDLGFKVLHEENYAMEYSPDRQETYLILWRPDGVLATMDSYTTSPEFGGVTLNSITLYGNWLPNEGVDRWKYTSSGGFERVTPGFDGDIPDDPWVWVGNWWGLEGVRNTLSNLDGNGKWLNPWRVQPMLHLYNHAHKSQADTKAKDWYEKWEAEKEARVALLPQNVQDAIRGLRDRHAR